jgi:hypothetical protein
MKPILINSSSDKFNEYVENLKKLNQENVPIYHYTSLEAMMKIVETKSLWATNCQYLNDIHETRYIINKLEEIAKKLNEYEKIAVKMTINEFNSDTYKNILKDIYIISFSKEKDSVSMWGNYGKNGVIMEFYAPEFLRGGIENEIKTLYNGNIKIIKIAKLFSYAIYDNNLIKDVVLFDIIKNINNVNEYDDNKAVELFLSLFLIKDKTYSYENEIRIVFSVLYDTDINDFEKYRLKNNLIIPYIDVSFEENGKLPLKSVMYNPEQNDVMYEESIKRFLKSHGYDIPVIPSKSKIR